MVFDPELALDSEEYQYINLNHPLVKSIVADILDDDSLSFDLEIAGYGEFINGNLFYYRLELTNNEGFKRRHTIPIFINQDGSYNPDVTQWFELNYEFDFKVDDMDDMIVDIEVLESTAERVLEEKIRDIMSENRLELLKKIEDEQIKSEIYFNDRTVAVSKIGIENIREPRLREIEEQRIKERFDLQRKRNLVPKTTLFAVAEVTLRP